MLTPASEQELAEAIASATGPLAIRGGGTRPVGHVEGAPLTTSAHSGITLYEPGALTLVAKAGTPVGEIETLLAGENQMLAFEPMDHRKLLGTAGTPTIGGVVAGNYSGPRRMKAGACRDFLLGVRFVDGQGTAIKNGGRVMKNVTGYDLVKLMAGAFGTLGVLSEVSFKVLPAPEAVTTLALHGLDVAPAVAAMSDALTSPYDVSGAAHAPVGPDGTPVTWLRLEGFESSVTYRAGALKDRLSKFGAVEIEARTEAWNWVRDVEGFADTEGDIWRISTRPSEAPALIERLGADQVMLDWGGGLIWAACAPGADLRRVSIPGHATRMRAGDKTLPTFHPEAAPLAQLARELRRKFDPRNVLNTGLMG